MTSGGSYLVVVHLWLVGGRISVAIMWRFARPRSEILELGHVHPAFDRRQPRHAQDVLRLEVAVSKRLLSPMHRVQGVGKTPDLGDNVPDKGTAEGWPSVGAPKVPKVALLGPLEEQISFGALLDGRDELYDVIMVQGAYLDVCLCLRSHSRWSPGRRMSLRATSARVPSY